MALSMWLWTWGKKLMRRGMLQRQKGESRWLHDLIYGTTSTRSRIHTRKVWVVVNNCIKDLFEEYRIKYAPNVALAESVAETESTGDLLSMMKSLIAKRMRLNNGSSCSSRSELDKFLAEEIEDDDTKFDILAWWKINSNRFPILACLARDVLAIPISSVASESAFSTGGRVLDDFRTSLTPFMGESLVCTQDWLRHNAPVCIAENIEELSKLEQELIAEYMDKAKIPNNLKPANKPSTMAQAKDAT